MRLLLDADILSDELLYSHTKEYEVDRAWNFLKSHQPVQGYITSYGIQRLSIDIYKRANFPWIAKKLLHDLQRGLNVCPINRSIIARAKNSSIANYDSAIEASCAQEMRLDAIITNEPWNFASSEFHRFSLKRLKLLSQGDQMISFCKRCSTPILLVGQLSDIGDLAEYLLERVDFCQFSVSEEDMGRPEITILREWLSNRSNGLWQPVDELIFPRNSVFDAVRRTSTIPLQKRGQLLRFFSATVALVVDFKFSDRNDGLDIKLSINPIENEVYLPDRLKAIIRGEGGTIIRDECQPLRTEKKKEGLVFEFLAGMGESFVLIVELQGEVIIERFKV